MADVVALSRYKGLKREQAAAFRQLAFEFELPDDVRVEIDNAIYRLTEKPGERWLFVKISPEQFRHVTKAIRSCSKPAITLSVWTAAITYMRQDTGEILATRIQLAEDSGTNHIEVSRAMTALTKIDAILKHRRGQRVVYSINTYSPNSWHHHCGLPIMDGRSRDGCRSHHLRARVGRW